MRCWYQYPPKKVDVRHTMRKAHNLCQDDSISAYNGILHMLLAKKRGGVSSGIRRDQYKFLAQEYKGNLLEQEVEDEVDVASSSSISRSSSSRTTSAGNNKTTPLKMNEKKDYREDAFRVWRERKEHESEDDHNSAKASTSSSSTSVRFTTDYEALKSKLHAKKRRDYSTSSTIFNERAKEYKKVKVFGNSRAGSTGGQNPLSEVVAIDSVEFQKHSRIFHKRRSASASYIEDQARRDQENEGA